MVGWFKFALLGAISSTIGGFLLSFGDIIEKVIGISIVILGVAYIFELQIFKGKSVNVWRFKGTGFVGGLLLGAAIGFVWIPCSSPVLGSMLLITAQKSIIKGMWLLFVYSLGISIPFLTIGTLLSKALSFGFGKPAWEKWTKIIGDSFIMLLGILILFGKMKV
ncbi:MAG: cytochrome c biogenesis protein CcdA [Fervidobacterium sp.]